MDNRQSTKGSGLVLLVLVLAIIGLVALIAYYFMNNPDAINMVLYVIALVILAIIVIGIIVALAAGLLAIPFYMKKGVQYQTGMEYHIEDVEAVKGKDLDDKKE